MRFFRSIRWRLQLWHGLLLAVVLAGFGVTTWRLDRASTFQRVDQDLERRVAGVSGALRRGDGPPDRAMQEPPPRPDRPADDRPPQARQPGGPPPDDQAAGERPPQDRPPRPAGQQDRRPPPRGQAAPDGPQDAAFYYVAWDGSGQELARSSAAPADVPKPSLPSDQRTARLRGTMREYIHFTPQGDCILVGRDVSLELAALRASAGLLLGAGGSVFVLGLAGGWWISKRALRPIAGITATAARISTGDLSQRVPATDDGSELDDLAQVLNDTFARLQSSFTRQAQFTADASHELRTPVSVVLTQTQTALARDRSPEEYRETLAACERAARRMRGLTDALLTLARLDSDAAVAAHAPCDLDRVAADAVELLRPVSDEHGVTVTMELQQPSRCTGHAGQLGQVVTNLVSNAIYYNTRGGTVDIRVTTEGRAAVLSVRDSGAGISPDDLPHIFERFYRTDRARSNSEGRTGLGLAIVKAIVDAHGGTIDVASQVGHGTTFTVRLPGGSSPPV